MSQAKGGKAAAAAKGKKPGKAGGEDKGEDVLQAVILADSFEDRFMPFALEKPRCLMTLANTPLIEYTLEYLAMNGVQEVYIYCGAHADQIESYISESSRWSPNTKVNPFQLVDFIKVSDATSMGDFLRDLDTRGIVAQDFILVHGDLVANIPLDDILTKHRARREANRDACMTMVLREAGEGEHRTKNKAVKPFFVVEPSTQRCLHYSEISPLDENKKILLDPHIFEHDEFELRADLIDCGIDICTPDVLALWSESFDFELPRKNFLHNILKDWELNGKMIYTEIVGEGYGARASNLQMYESVTRDVLGRWTSPMVPDSNLVDGHSYRRGKNGVISETGVAFEAKTEVSKSVIGLRSVIGHGAKVTNSVIGRRCHIGKNVRLENAILWDDVTVQENSTITRSMLADEVTVGVNCTIPAGTLVSNGVVIGDNIAFEEAVKLSLYDTHMAPLPNDTALLGPNGRGARFVETDEDLDEHDPARLQKSLIYSTEGFNISQGSISTIHSEAYTDSDSNSDDALDSAIKAEKSTRIRLDSLASDDSGAAKTTSFEADAVNGLLDALRDDTGDYDSAKLEFMGLRLSSNASDSAVRRSVATAFVKRAAELLTPQHGGLEPAKAAERTLKGKTGAAKFVQEVGVGAGEVDEQVEFAFALQKALAGYPGLESSRAGLLLAALFQQLYGLEILEEEGILAWWEDQRTQEGESLSALRLKCKVLVDWLQEDDDDDSSEEDDSD